MMRVGIWLIVVSCAVLSGCSRIYPPAAFVNFVAPVYPDPRPENCHVPLLTDAPTEPYEIFAQIAGYAGSAEMSERMLALIKANACEIGADALVLSPLQHDAHTNSDSIYPDWVTAGEGGGEGERFQHWQDKRYNVAQRALALIYKKNVSTGRTQKSGE
jgi:hypothetical protein